MPDVDHRDRRLDHLARGPGRRRHGRFNELIEDGVERHANHDGTIPRELQHGGVLGLIGVAGHDHRGDPDGMAPPSGSVNTTRGTRLVPSTASTIPITRRLRSEPVRT